MQDVTPAVHEKSQSNLLVAFGGVDYGEPLKGQKARPLEDMAKHLNMRAARELEGMKYLKHSLYEAEAIARIFETNCKEGRAVVYKKKDATEHNLKNLERPPGILHLSTHGFYLAGRRRQPLALRRPAPNPAVFHQTSREGVPKPHNLVALCYGGKMSDGK